MTFNDRNSSHKTAMKTLEEQLSKYNVIIQNTGLESTENFNPKDYLYHYKNTSKEIRFKPDYKLTFKNQVTCNLEVKSTNNAKYETIAMELEAIINGEFYENLYYAFIHNTLNYIKIVHIDNIKNPESIVFTQRSSEKEKEYYKSIFPQSAYMFRPTQFGSGTPYTIIPKNPKNSMTVEEFVKKMEME